MLQDRIIAASAWAIIALLILLSSACVNSTDVVAVEWAEYGYTIHSDLTMSCNDTLPFKPAEGWYNDADFVCHWPCAHLAEQPFEIWTYFFQHDLYVQVVHEIATCLEE